MKQSVTKKLNVLITGASSGIGNMTAVYFAKKGHTVFGTSRNPEKVEKRADELFTYIKMDVTNEASVNETIQTLLQKIEKLDVVICNAGMGISGPIETTPIEYIEKQINTNFWGTLRVLRSVLPSMREKGGKIFVIGSMAGRAGIPFQGYYAASKFALEGLVESLRYELMEFPVQVSIIEPGDFRTGFTGSRLKFEDEKDPYYKKCKQAVSIMEQDEQHGANPLMLAQLLYKLSLNTRKLKVRYSIGMLFQRFAMLLKRILPCKLYEYLFSKYYNVS